MEDLDGLVGRAATRDPVPRCDAFFDGNVDNTASTTDSLFDAVNPIDGLKMFAFAVMIARREANVRSR